MATFSVAWEGIVLRRKSLHSENLPCLSCHDSSMLPHAGRYVSSFAEHIDPTMTPCWDNIFQSFSICTRAALACHEMCYPPKEKYSFSIIVFSVNWSDGDTSGVLQRQSGRKTGLQLLRIPACVFVVGPLYTESASESGDLAAFFLFLMWEVKGNDATRWRDRE